MPSSGQVRRVLPGAACHIYSADITTRWDEVQRGAEITYVASTDNTPDSGEVHLYARLDRPATHSLTSSRDHPITAVAEQLIITGTDERNSSCCSKESRSWAGRPPLQATIARLTKSLRRLTDSPQFAGRRSLAHLSSGNQEGAVTLVHPHPWGHRENLPD